MQSKQPNTPKNMQRNIYPNDMMGRRMVKSNNSVWAMYDNVDNNGLSPDCLNMQCVAGLNDYSSATLGANCRFEPIFDPAGIIHKVSFIKYF